MDLDLEKEYLKYEKYVYVLAKYVSRSNVETLGLHGPLRGDPLEDLHQEGRMALWKALHRYVREKAKRDKYNDDCDTHNNKLNRLYSKFDKSKRFIEIPYRKKKPVSSMSSYIWMRLRCEYSNISTRARGMWDNKNKRFKGATRYPYGLTQLSFEEELYNKEEQINKGDFYFTYSQLESSQKDVIKEYFIKGRRKDKVARELKIKDIDKAIALIKKQFQIFV